MSHAAYCARAKKATLKKLFCSTNQTISQLAKAEGISKTALYGWKQELLAESKVRPLPQSGRLAGRE